MNAKRTPLIVLALGVLLAGSTHMKAAGTIQFSSTTYSVAEDGGTVALRVLRTNDLSSLVTVDYTCTDGTATNGVNYSGTSGTLTFSEGLSEQSIIVPILNEGLVGLITTFKVTLSNPSAEAVLGSRSTATVRIADNDKGAQFEFANYSVGEGDGSVLIGVLRGNDDNYPASIDYTTVDGTAKTGRDYLTTGGRFDFSAGEQVKLLSVPILNNAVKDGNRVFQLYLTNANNTVLAVPKVAKVTILDNDPGLQFEFPQYWVSDTDGQVALRVLRANDLDLRALTVDYATSDSTAKAGQDFTLTTGTLEFAEGEMEKSVRVPIARHDQPKVDVKFKVSLINPSAGGYLGTNKSATVTILDATGMREHRFEKVTRLPDGNVELALSGAVSKRFLPHFDLYPIEVSTNLLDWTPLVTLSRTNSSTNALTYTDSSARTAACRFYRMVTSNLITPFRPPTGPMPVGVVSRLLTDPTRRNRYFVSTNGSFMVLVWYPANTTGGMLPEPLAPWPMSQDPLWSYSATAADVTISMVGLCSTAIPCASGSYPVVVFSPGFTGTTHSIDERGPDFASHGYVVVAIDHFDATATAFPDGRILHGYPSDASLSNAGFQDRVKDLSFVLEELSRWSVDDPLFAGHLDLNNVATMGYSWGGGVAAETARTDARVRALILIDAYLQHADDVVQVGVPKPQMGVYSQAAGGDSTLYDKTVKDAIWFMLRSSVHLNFDDYYNAGFGGGANDRLKSMTFNAYAVWFLNKYLKGSPDPMPSSKDYPLVFNLKQK